MSAVRLRAAPDTSPPITYAAVDGRAYVVQATHPTKPVAWLHAPRGRVATMAAFPVLAVVPDYDATAQEAADARAVAAAYYCAAAIRAGGTGGDDGQ